MLNVQVKYSKSKAKLGWNPWCIDTRYVLKDGTRKFYPSKEEAIHALDNLNKVISPTAKSKDTWKWTFSELREFYIERMYKLYNSGKKSKTFYVDRERHSRQFLAFEIDGEPIANMRVSDLSSAMVQDDIMDQLEVAENGGERSRKTIENMLGSISHMMNFAKVRGCRETNPIDGVERMGKELKENKDKAEKIATHIIEAIEAEMSPEWAFEMRFAYTTGLRQGEQRALTWGCINLEDSKLNITRAIKHRAGVGDPKSYSGKRTINLSRDVLQDLKEFYIRKGRPNDPNALVFGNGNGNCKTSNSYLVAIHDACDAAGVPRIRWHDLRHYYASKLLQVYSNELWKVRTYLGHSSIQITQETYGHWIEKKGENTKDVDTVTDIFARH